MLPNRTVEQHQFGCRQRDEGPHVRTTKPVLLHPTTCSSLCTQTFVGLMQDLKFVSEKTIDSTNVHFAMHKGAALTFGAPAVKIAREVKRHKKYTAVTCRCLKLARGVGIVHTSMNGIKDENTRCLFAATAYHSGILSRFTPRASLTAGARKVSVAPSWTVKCKLVASIVLADVNVRTSFTSTNSRANTVGHVAGCSKTGLLDHPDW